MADDLLANDFAWSDQDPAASHRFSDAIRAVLGTSRAEATALGHDYVGTEHELLALLASVDTVASQMLDALEVDRASTRREILSVVKRGRGQGGPDTPFTSRAKKVLELAIAESREQELIVRDVSEPGAIGTGHLLLGLIREEKGIAGQTLANAGVTLDSARRACQSILMARAFAIGALATDGSVSIVLGAPTADPRPVLDSDPQVEQHEHEPEHLRLRIAYPSDLDVSDVSNAVVELYRALNRWHILAGGSGLVVDSWGVAEREPSYAGV